ncbi:MAG: EAL domain-containing protein [Rhodospirillaceae bacterium]
MDGERHLTVLIVEDEETDAELCRRELLRAGMRCGFNRVDTRAAFEAALESTKPDLIISDFTLPTAFDGLAALQLAAARVPDVPFIFVSGTIGEERAVEAMRRGATDYVLKDRLHRLVPVVRRALAEARDRRARARAEAELAETKSRLDSILASITDAVWSLSANGEVVYLNPAVELIWGRPREFLDNPENWRRALFPPDAARVEAAWDAMTTQGLPFDAEFRIVRGDGSVRWVHSRGHAVRADDGSILRIDGLTSDITLRKKQEERIARLNRIHAMLSGINSVIVRVKDRTKLFDEACRIAVEHAGFRMAWIGVVDTQTNRLSPVAHRGHEAGYLKAIGVVNRVVGEHAGAAARAIRSKRPVIVDDIATEGGMIYRQEALSRGYRALAALPLFLQDAAVGVLLLYATETGFFNAEEMKLLDELAGDISFALDHIAKTERVDYLAYYDGLTGLPNRTLFFDRLNQMVRGRTAHSHVACVVLDVERFHVINDTFGTAAGDTVLQQLAQRLTGALSEATLLTRLSGDRYAFGLPAVEEVSEIVHLLEGRVLSAVAAPFTLNGQELRVQMRAGIAVCPDDGANANTLMKNAEAALHTAKRHGSRYCFYEPEMNVKVAEKLRLENRLRVALDRNEFVLYYQPRVNLITGKLTGLEALLRWQPAGEPLVLPNDFVHLLEETGMIVEVGAWAVREAAFQCVRWRAKGYEPPRVALNVSAVQLRQPDFVGDILDGITAAGSMPEQMSVEITESMLMESLESGIAKLARLRDAGVEIALDDFGTGYSSLGYLAQLPVAALKIDRSFVARLTGSTHDTAIVSTIVSLGRTLRLNVIAEGVETEEQANLLRSLGCEEAQGYLFGRPLTAADVENLMPESSTS